jgi:hypothetical protein
MVDATAIDVMLFDVQIGAVVEQPVEHLCRLARRRNNCGRNGAWRSGQWAVKETAGSVPLCGLTAPVAWARRSAEVLTV